MAARAWQLLGRVPQVAPALHAWLENPLARAHADLPDRSEMPKDFKVWAWGKQTECIDGFLELVEQRPFEV